MTTTRSTLRNRRLLAGAVTAALLCALFYPGKGSGNYSLTTFFAPPTGNDYAEFVAHFLMFTVFTLVVYRAFPTLKRPLGFAITVAVSVAIGTEFLQSLVQRGVYFLDLLANLAGIAVATHIIRRTGPNSPAAQRTDKDP